MATSWQILVLAILAILPLFAVGDTCLSPDVKSQVFTTSDAAVGLNTVFVVEFSVECKNGLRDLNLYAELNGQAIPASKIKDTNKYQVSFSNDHKDAPAGDYVVNFFDEEGYSALRKAQRSGDDVNTIKNLFNIPIRHNGASQGTVVQSEFVAATVATVVWYFAYNARSKLQSSS